jgi:hypothetical protein
MLQHEETTVVLHQPRERPEPWQAHKRHAPGWLAPLCAIDWLCAWIAHLLSRWVLLEVLEYLSTFSILIAVIFYFAESGDRIKQKHYQAWQVINTAQGRGGSGGRIEALEELNADRVPLVGVDLSDAFLQGIELNKANLQRSNFKSADLRGSSLQSANLAHVSFDTANLRGGNLRNANVTYADLQDADLFGADLSGTDLEGVRLDRADLRNANLRGARWQHVASIRSANLFGAKNLPPGFADWARAHGAVAIDSGDQWSPPPLK